MNNHSSNSRTSHSTSALALVSLLAFAAASPAQQLGMATSPPHASMHAPPSRTPLGDDAFRLPLHKPRDSETGDLWASHDSYKVRIASNGMQFFPVLGERAPVSLPLHWRTTRIGSNDVTTASAVSHADWRAELRHKNGVVEAYDLLDAGVEQTFVFATAPALHGATFVIEGAIETALHANERGAMHASISFHDEKEQATINYGEAYAFDASGNSIELATSFAEGKLRIHVPTMWMATAQYPVTVDPLTSRSTIVGGSNGGVYAPQTIVDRDTDQLLISYSRAIAANDYDAYARVRDTDFHNLGVIYTDVGTSSAKQTSVGWVRSTDSWVVAIGSLTPSASRVFVHIHPTDHYTASGGQTMLVPQSPGYEHQRPVISGARSNEFAYVVFERDPGSGQPDTNATQIYGAIIDTINGTTATPAAVQDSNLVDAQRPSINPEAFYGTDWLIAWQERSTLLPNDDWDIAMAKANGGGVQTSIRALPVQNSVGLHSFQPKVAGDSYQYVVAFLTRPVNGTPVTQAGTRLQAQGFDWNYTNSSIGNAREYVIDTSPTSTIELNDAARSVAMHQRTKSHFTIAWRRLGNWAAGTPTQLMAARYGYDDPLLESHELESSTGLIAAYGSPSVSYDYGNERFALTYGGTGLGTNSVYGRHLNMPAATTTPYGNSCAGTLTTKLPYAGTRRFYLSLEGAAPSTATWLWGALAPGYLALPTITNCPVLLDVTAAPVIVDQDVTNNSGEATFIINLPSSIVGMDLYWQAMQLQIGSLFDMSNGVATEIR